MVAFVLLPLVGAWVMRLGMRWALVPLIGTVAAAAISVLIFNQEPQYLVVIATEAAYIAVAAVLFRLVLRAEKVSTAGPEVEPAGDQQHSG